MTNTATKNILRIVLAADRARNMGHSVLPSLEIMCETRRSKGGRWAGHGERVDPEVGGAALLLTSISGPTLPLTLLPPPPKHRFLASFSRGLVKIPFRSQNA